MASKNFGRGTEEWMMFVDFWELCKKHWVPEDSDQYWDELISDMNDFSEKYKDVVNGDFAVKLAIAFCDAKDLEFKNK